MLKFYNENRKKGLSKQKDAFLFHILTGLINTQYKIFLKMDNSKQTKQELMDFDHQLKTANRMLYESEEGKKLLY